MHFRGYCIIVYTIYIYMDRRTYFGKNMSVFFALEYLCCFLSTSRASYFSSPLKSSTRTWGLESICIVYYVRVQTEEGVLGPGFRKCCRGLLNALQGVHKALQGSYMCPFSKILFFPWWIRYIILGSPMLLCTIPKKILTSSSQCCGSGPNYYFLRVLDMQMVA